MKYILMTFVIVFFTACHHPLEFLFPWHGGGGEPSGHGGGGGHGGGPGGGGGHGH